MVNALVSVIIPVYETVDYLAEAIASVRAQDYPNIEIILVDDGSSVAVAQQIEAISQSEKASYIRQENNGPAIARRNGVHQAQGEFIWFFDADDILLPGAITHLVETLQNNPGAIAAYGRRVFIDGRGDFSRKQVLPGTAQIVSGNVLPSLLKGVPLLSPGSICIRKNALTESMFPENVRQGEDWITWCRLALAGDILYAGPRVVIGMRAHARNLSNEALVDPSLLLAMLPIVFEDPAIVARVGKTALALYHAQHLRTIYTYLYFNAPGGKATYRKQARAMPTIAKGEKIRVLHVVKHFYAGGAERLLSNLLKYGDQEKYEHIVLSLSNRDERIRHVEDRLNIPFRAIETDSVNRFACYRLCYDFVKKLQPDVIKSWLPPANIFGGLAGVLLGIPVLWGIHDVQDPRRQPAVVRWQLYLAKWLPKHVVCCSDAVYATCKQAGYPEKLLEVIPNGIDSNAFSFQPQGRKRVRAELGIDDRTLLIGMAAEYTYIKRPEYFLAAAKMFLQQHPNTRFLLCGQNMTQENITIKRQIELLGLAEAVYLMGIRDDMAAIYSALDIHTLTSQMESFGLAVLEAAACKTLSVATDVGVMKELLADVGYIIPATSDANVLAEAWQQAANVSSEEKTRRLEEGRKRSLRYSIAETAKRYDMLYARMAKQ